MGLMKRFSAAPMPQPSASKQPPKDAVGVVIDDSISGMLAAIQIELRDRVAKKAVREATEIVHELFQRRVEVVGGYLKTKSKIKVSQGGKWGDTFWGRITAPHVHLYEKGFTHKDHDGKPSSGGDIEGHLLVASINQKTKKRQAAAIWRHLKKAAKKVQKQGARK